MLSALEYFIVLALYEFSIIITITISYYTGVKWPLHVSYFVFSSSAYRWTHFPCTSTNPVGSTHRVQQNWAVTGFKDDCVEERLWDFWQSRGGELHVFCTFRAAWPHQRNSNVPWWVTPNCCTTPSGKPQAGKYLITLLECTHLQYTRIDVAFARYIVLISLKVKKNKALSTRIRNTGPHEAYWNLFRPST